MAKRRSCRRTREEEDMHERAVRIRKMTDEQICKYMDVLKDEAFDKGYRKGNKELPKQDEAQKVKEKGNRVQEFLDLIMVSPIKGVGPATANKLVKVAKDNGFI